MLGLAKFRDRNRPVVGSLDDLGPEDHVYRHHDARLDLSFVRDGVRGADPSLGCLSVDPVVGFTL